MSRHSKVGKAVLWGLGFWLVLVISFLIGGLAAAQDSKYPRMDPEMEWVGIIVQDYDIIEWIAFNHPDPLYRYFWRREFFPETREWDGGGGVGGWEMGGGMGSPIIGPPHPVKSPRWVQSRKPLTDKIRRIWAFADEPEFFMVPVTGISLNLIGDFKQQSEEGNWYYYAVGTGPHLIIMMKNGEEYIHVHGEQPNATDPELWLCRLTLPYIGTVYTGQGVFQ